MSGLPFGFPLDRPDVHLSPDTLEGINADYPPQGIAVHAEAAARLFAKAAKRIRNGESVRDVCLDMADVVIALSGRI